MAFGGQGGGGWSMWGGGGAGGGGGLGPGAGGGGWGSGQGGGRGLGPGAFGGGWGQSQGGGGGLGPGAFGGGWGQSQGGGGGLGPGAGGRGGLGPGAFGGGWGSGQGGGRGWDPGAGGRGGLGPGAFGGGWGSGPGEPDPGFGGGFGGFGWLGPTDTGYYNPFGGGSGGSGKTGPISSASSIKISEIEDVIVTEEQAPNAPIIHPLERDYLSYEFAFHGTGLAIITDEQQLKFPQQSNKHFHLSQIKSWGYELDDCIAHERGNPYDNQIWRAMYVSEQEKLPTGTYVAIKVQSWYQYRFKIANRAAVAAAGGGGGGGGGGAGAGAGAGAGGQQQQEDTYEPFTNQTYESLMKESKLVRNLNHPNVVKIYDIFTLPLHPNVPEFKYGFCCSVMPCMDGSLLEMMRRIQPLNNSLNEINVFPYQITVSMARQIAGAVHYLHYGLGTRYVSHLAISSRNILYKTINAIKNEYLFVLTDFEEAIEFDLHPVHGFGDKMSPNQARHITIDGRYSAPELRDINRRCRFRLEGPGDHGDWQWATKMRRHRKNVIRELLDDKSIKPEGRREWLQEEFKTIINKLIGPKWLELVHKMTFQMHQRRPNIKEVVDELQNWPHVECTVTTSRSTTRGAGAGAGRYRSKMI
ncbi:uncharacterized protein LOC128962888 [Oppia nitens]|uniref:uncharacterized protein LOC128962888 n=1 Tax=Oppia nitens TaxID=1686743 RepID=UPI0023DCDDF2|nr:uncharacterized protein LOC128962888 [Oppia nitens]